MAENLRTIKFNNGDTIQQITSNRYWQEVSDFSMNDSTLNEIWPVMSFYNNEAQKHNALYNWYVVFDDRGVCPLGWHVPSMDEYVELIENLGGLESAITKLKSTSSWSKVGTNVSGFNALPIGIRFGSGEFDLKNEETGFWTDEVIEEINEYNNAKSLMSIVFKVRSENNKSELRPVFFNAAHSIRCIKN